MSILTISNEEYESLRKNIKNELRENKTKRGVKRMTRKIKNNPKLARKLLGLLKGKKSSPPKFNVDQSRFVRQKQEVRRTSDGFFK